MLRGCRRQEYRKYEEQHFFYEFYWETATECIFFSVLFQTIFCWYSITLLILIKNIEFNLPKRKKIQKDKQYSSKHISPLVHFFPRRQCCCPYTPGSGVRWRGSLPYLLHLLRVGHYSLPGVLGYAAVVDYITNIFSWIWSENTERTIFTFGIP